MKPSKRSRRKKRNRSNSSPASDNPQIGADEPPLDANATSASSLYCLIEAFPAASPEEIASANEAASRDADKAAEILSASPGAAAKSVEPTVFLRSPKVGRRRQCLVASAGMVSGVIGKGYVAAGSRRKGSTELKANSSRNSDCHKEAEEFLYSMLGDECLLNFGVIRDVFCQCGYDLEKALDTLLKLSVSSSDNFLDNICGSSSDNSSSGSASHEGCCNDLADCITRKCLLAGDSMLSPSGKGHNEVLQSARHGHRDATKAMFKCNEHLSRSDATKSYLAQKVLESLFSIPESSERKPSSMDWKSIVKKMESFGQDLEFYPSNIPETVHNTEHAKGDDYQVLRSAARQHWDTTKSYFQKAAVAYSRGEGVHAAYLSEQGRHYRQKAQEADERASQEIFEARNKGIKNTMTIDLHGQQVKEAMRLLKMHLILFIYLPSIRFFTVITGCGTNGVGTGKIKQSVIALMKKEGMEWSEENRGTIVIRLDGRKEYGFFQSDSDSE